MKLKTMEVLTIKNIIIMVITGMKVRIVKIKILIDLKTYLFLRIRV